MEFEEIKYKLTKSQHDFFYELKKYIELQIYFMGSIIRYDYYKGYSDLDIMIFSSNINSTRLKIRHFLYTEKKDKIIFVHINKQPISGYKFYYNNCLNGEKKVDFDLTIFKENSKKQFLIMSKKQADMSFLCIIYFLIIKTLYYNIGIIDKHMYKNLKDFFWESNNNGFNPIFVDYDEYKSIYKKNYPNVKYMINL